MQIFGKQKFILEFMGKCEAWGWTFERTGVFVHNNVKEKAFDVEEKIGKTVYD